MASRDGTQLIAVGKFYEVRDDPQKLNKFIELGWDNEVTKHLTDPNHEWPLKCLLKYSTPSYGSNSSSICYRDDITLVCRGEDYVSHMQPLPFKRIIVNRGRIPDSLGPPSSLCAA